MLNIGLGIKITNSKNNSQTLDNIYYLSTNTDSIIDENNNYIELVII